MESAYITFPFSELKEKLDKNHGVRFKTKTLQGGFTMEWYTVILTELQQCIRINETVYAFDNIEAAYHFFERTDSAPAGTGKREYKIDETKLIGPIDLNFYMMGYSLFKRRKCNDLKTLSIVTLKDGRTSELYGNCSYCGFWTYYLVIGKMVFYQWSIEEIKKLEHAIDNGSASYWRPELAGTMDYVPKYTIRDFDKCRNRKFASKDLFIKSYEMSDNVKAEVFKLAGKSTRHYMRRQDKLYSFASLEDCELVITQLQTRSAQSVPIKEDECKKSLQTDVVIVAARLSRYMSADMEYCKRSDVLSVSQTGALTGLTAIL